MHYSAMAVYLFVKQYSLASRKNLTLEPPFTEAQDFNLIEEFMIQKTLYRRIFASAMIVLFGLSAMVQARPMPQNLFVQQDEKKKLLPVNWVRSRKIDVKHIDLDLRFDWDKTQAIGVETITFSPFSDTDKLHLTRRR